MASYGAWRALGVLVLATICTSLVDLENYCRELEDGYYCATCLNPVYCSSGETTELETCLYEVCEGNQVYTACVAMEEATRCHCTNPTQCDSYSPEYVSKCRDEGMYDVLPCEDEEQTCSGGKCGAEVPGVNSCDDDGAVISDWNFITPDCTQGFYCYENGDELPVQCKANEYIDANGICLAAPPEACASGCTGPCPNNTDCTRYYYCDGAGTVLDETQCPEGQFFDPKADPVPMCQEDENRCAPLTYCNFDGKSTPTTTTTTTSTTTTTTPTTTSTTTTTTSTPTTTSTSTTTTATTTTTTFPPPPPCSEENVGNYPVGPCSPYYWACRNTGGGDYDVNLGMCPDDLIFNTDPYWPYCEQPENVYTCNIRGVDQSYL